MIAYKENWETKVKTQKIIIDKIVPGKWYYLI